MNIDINTSEITFLLGEVERKSAITPRLVSDFGMLADIISADGERLSQSTIERVWQYSTRRKSAVSQHTLDVLSRYAGHADWQSFCHHVKANAHPESDYFTDGILDVEALPDGALLSLYWLPNRKITIRYQGNRRFEVVQSLNSSIRPCDRFECSQIQIGQPLYLDRFSRAGVNDKGLIARYVIGKDSGIISIQTIEGQMT